MLVTSFNGRWEDTMSPETGKDKRDALSNLLGVDRRAFLMRSAMIGVVKKSKGPVMTVLEQFYKVGPGPSSSHT
jgi:L-serine dehydratase